MLLVRTSDGLNAPCSVKHPPRLSVPQILAISHVTADGEDLDYIRQRFAVPLPIPLEKDSVTWFGDHARFIMANL